MKKICIEPGCGRDTHLDLDFCFRCSELPDRGEEKEAKCKECGKVVKYRGPYSPFLWPGVCKDCKTILDERGREEIKERIAAQEKAEAEEKEQQRIFAEKERVKYAAENIPPMFSDAMVENLNISLMLPEFLIFGDFGTGKTYTAYALTRQLFADKEIDTFRVTRAFKMMMDIKSSFSGGSYERTFSEYLSLDMLIVDEWGKNSGTEFEESVLFEIINSRYEARKRTGIIVNAKNKEDLLTLIRPDVLDRFRRGIVEINGKSRR